MWWVLRFTIAVRSRFAKLPHWLRDLYGLISYVNFIELTPTLAAIALAPRHFFRRLPLILKGARTTYLTPVKFFFNVAALLVTLFYMRSGDWTGLINQNEAFWFMPLLIPMTPVAMALLGAICWLLYQAPRMAPNGDAFPPPNSGPFKLILDPRSYTRLNATKYLWGLFYISVYFVAIWQVVQVAIAMNFLSVVYFVSQLEDGHLLVKGIVILLSIALVAISIHALVLHPYMEMFRAAMRRPTRAVFETDVHEIRQIMLDIANLSPSHPNSVDIAGEMTHLQETEIAALQCVVAQHEHDFEFSVTDRQLRRDVYIDALGLGSQDNESLVDQLDRMLLPTSALQGKVRRAA